MAEWENPHANLLGLEKLELSKEDTDKVLDVARAAHDAILQVTSGVTVGLGQVHGLPAMFLPVAAHIALAMVKMSHDEAVREVLPDPTIMEHYDEVAQTLWRGSHKRHQERQKEQQ